MNTPDALPQETPKVKFGDNLSYLRKNLDEVNRTNNEPGTTLISGNIGYFIGKSSTFKIDADSRTRLNKHMQTYEKLIVSVVGQTFGELDAPTLGTQGWDQSHMTGGVLNWNNLLTRMSSMMGVRSTEPADTRIFPNTTGDNYVTPIFNMLCSVGLALIKRTTDANVVADRKFGRQFANPPDARYYRPWFTDNHCVFTKGDTSFLRQGDFLPGPPQDDVTISFLTFNPMQAAACLRESTPFTISRNENLDIQRVFEIQHFFGRKKRTNFYCDVNIPCLIPKRFVFLYYKDKNEEWDAYDADGVIELPWDDPQALWSYTINFVTGYRLWADFEVAYNMFLAVFARPLYDSMEGAELLWPLNTIILPRPVFVRTIMQKAFVEQSSCLAGFTIPPDLMINPLVDRWCDYSMAWWTYVDQLLSVAIKDTISCNLRENSINSVIERMTDDRFTLDLGRLLGIAVGKGDTLSSVPVKFSWSDKSYILNGRNGFCHELPDGTVRVEGTHKYKRHLSAYVPNPLVSVKREDIPSFSQADSLLVGSVRFLHTPDDKLVVGSKREARLFANIAREWRWRVIAEVNTSIEGRAYVQRIPDEVSFGADSRALSNPLALEGINDLGDLPSVYVFDAVHSKKKRIRIHPDDLYASVLEVATTRWLFKGYHTHRHFRGEGYESEPVITTLYKSYCKPTPEDRSIVGSIFSVFNAPTIPPINFEPKKQTEDCAFQELNLTASPLDEDLGGLGIAFADVEAGPLPPGDPMQDQPIDLGVAVRPAVHVAFHAQTGAAARRGEPFGVAVPVGEPAVRPAAEQP